MTLRVFVLSPSQSPLFSFRRFFGLHHCALSCDDNHCRLAANQLPWFDDGRGMHCECPRRWRLRRLARRQP